MKISLKIIEKYFKWPSLKIDDEVATEDLGDLNYYVKALFNEHNDLILLEEYHNNELRSVSYNSNKKSFQQIINRHIEKYGNLKFKISTPFHSRDGFYIEKAYFFDENHELNEIKEFWNNTSHLTISEKRFDKDEKLLGRIDFEYDDKNELIKSKEYNNTGELINEFDFDDD